MGLEWLEDITAQDGRLAAEKLGRGIPLQGKVMTNLELPNRRLP